MNENLEEQFCTNKEMGTYLTEPLANQISIFRPYQKYEGAIVFSSKSNLLDVVKHLSSMNAYKKVGRNFTNT